MASAKKRVIAIQNVEDELFHRVVLFLEGHKKIPSISAVAKVALENYLDLADQHGIDADWRVRVPVYREPNKEAHDTIEAQ